MVRRWVLGALVLCCACGQDQGGGDASEPSSGGTPPSEAGDLGAIELPQAACDAAGGDDTVAEPQLLASLGDRWHEAWLASAAIADVDGDGQNEVLAARGNLLLGWHLDGEIVYRAEVSGGRIWASPVVADLDPSRDGLEIAVAAREEVVVFDAEGQTLPGFPAAWRDELRALAAGDIDGDGRFELVAVTTNKLSENDRLDIVIAFEMDGSVVPGFPPNTTGTSECDDRCYTQGGFDQTLALGDLDGDGAADIFAPQDNAYVSLHRGDGLAFDADAMFEHPTKTNGVRFLHQLSEAQQGWAPEEETALQAHFTNSAPAIADLDDDGALDLIVLGSVQNAAQSDRFKGVALWAFSSRWHPTGSVLRTRSLSGVPRGSLGLRRHQRRRRDQPGQRGRHLRR